MLRRRSLLELVGKTEAKPLVEPKAEVAKFESGPQFFQHSKSPTGIATSFENALVAIKMLKVDCSYDVFHDKIHVTNLSEVAISESVEGFEHIALLLRRKVLLEWGFDPGKQLMEDALRLECLDHTFDPVREYLDGLKWDGVPRIDRWLVRYCGCDDTPLNRAFGRKWLVAGVRRVREPGCKFDTMLVLEGFQGQGKSTLFLILAGGDENFSDAEIIGDDKKKQQEAVQGVWIYEIGELEGMAKRDVTAIKLFLSKTHDRARPAFGRARVDRARRCVFAGTTNDDTYLRDTTGNRRVWPAKAHGLIDLDGVRRDRDQLWAEAAAMEASGEALTLPSTLWSIASIEQQARLAHDPWEDLIERHLSTLRDKTKDGKDVVQEGYAVGINDRGEREWRVASSYLLGPSLLGIAVTNQNQATTKHLADVMRTLGWGSGKTIRTTKPCRGYTKPIDEGKGEPAAIDGPKVEPIAVDEPRALVVVERPKLRLIRRPVRTSE
jgi:putative DNA primase/helicase